MNRELLRAIPKMDELLMHPLLQKAVGEAGQMAVTRAARGVLDELREGILERGLAGVPGLCQLAENTLERLHEQQRPHLRKILNATGVILHTNLGRAPLAPSAVEAVMAAAEGYTNLEYDVETGERGSRYSHVAGLLKELTGAEDAMAVNNNAGAVLLLLSALTAGREVIVSRGELVEIGGAFRVPDIMAQGGAILREVGTTNRTRAADYENAIDPGRTAALLKVHTSNYKIMGFTEDTPLEEMVALGKKHDLPVYYDLGSGSLLALEGAGILGEPCVTDCLKTGVDVVAFSGDKLFGGPQAGILLGKKEAIAAIRRHPLTRALRIDKLTLAALEATLRLYRDTDAKTTVPTQRMLREGRESLRPKAQRLLEALALPEGLAKVVDEEGQVGGGSVPTQLLPSAAVEIHPADRSVAVLEKALRRCEVPVVARIARDRLILDVRTLEEADFALLAQNLRGALGL